MERKRLLKTETQTCPVGLGRAVRLSLMRPLPCGFRLAALDGIFVSALSSGGLSRCLEEHRHLRYDLGDAARGELILDEPVELVRGHAVQFDPLAGHQGLDLGGGRVVDARAIGDCVLVIADDDRLGVQAKPPHLGWPDGAIGRN
jgi:hypothetical protein